MAAYDFVVVVLIVCISAPQAPLKLRPLSRTQLLTFLYLLLGYLIPVLSFLRESTMLLLQPSTRLPNLNHASNGLTWLLLQVHAYSVVEWLLFSSHVCTSDHWCLISTRACIHLSRSSTRAIIQASPTPGEVFACRPTCLAILCFVLFSPFDYPFWFAKFSVKRGVFHQLCLECVVTPPVLCSTFSQPKIVIVFGA